MAVSEGLLRAFRSGSYGRFRSLTVIGIAARTDFLRYRPVLDNTRLKEEFGYTPRCTTREAFTAWRTSQGL